MEDKEIAKGRLNMKATKDAEESNMKSDMKIVKDGIGGVGTRKEDGSTNKDVDVREEDLDEEDEEDLSRSRVQFKLAISVIHHV